MAWYKAGTVTITQGQAKVSGGGTLFNSGARIGDSFVGPDGLTYEIVNIVSDTELTIDPAYRGASAGGQAYRILPTQGYLADAAARMADLISGMAAVRDGIGQGLTKAGSAALPALRNQDDQDTGVFFPTPNTVGFSAGGVGRLLATTSGAAIAGSLVMSEVEFPSIGLTRNNVGTWYMGGGYQAGSNAWHLRFNTSAPYVTATEAGNVGLGTPTPQQRLHVAGRAVLEQPSGPAFLYLKNADGSADTRTSYIAATNRFLLFGYVSDAFGSAVEQMRIDPAGNLLVGATSGTAHTIRKGVTGEENKAILSVGYGPGETAAFFAQAGTAPSAAACNFRLNAASSTGRSINAGGTINASGADYAEYMRKANACGVIARGQIVGIDADGLLMDKFSLAHSFVIKSTDPSLVGGDTWSPGPPPAEPLLVLPTYDGPVEPAAPAGVARELPAIGERPAQPGPRAIDEDDMSFVMRMTPWVLADAAWVAAMNARPQEVEAVAIAIAADEEALARYAVELPAWKAAQADFAAAVAAAEQTHDAAMVQYAADKSAWDAEMERCRARVDRIAFSGQVPVNIRAGTFKPGDYIVANEGPDDTIIGLVITNATMRDPEYAGLRCDAVGKVWRTMEDGRAWCAVLIG